jgi:hypothetical protein
MQSFTGINDMRGLIAFDASAVPEVRLVADEFRWRCRHTDAIRRLSSSAASGFECPAQARFAFINSERIDEVFAAKASDANCRISHK